jgi:ubiquinone/menaquinone biosynthesis C-methylase UbiE
MTEGHSDIEKLSELAKFSGDPWNPRNAYFERAEGLMEAYWTGLVWPFIKDSDFTRVVDLAAGHGRNTVKLLDVAGEVFILDIQSGNVDLCKERFARNSNVQCAVNNGFDLRPVPDGWATLVYCFDAMVHFDSDIVRSYLRDALRVLKPGGRGFFHHSNYTQGTADWRIAPHSRNFMSKEFFAHYAIKEGLNILAQRTVNWGGLDALDCVTLVQKPA